MQLIYSISIELKKAGWNLQHTETYLKYVALNIFLIWSIIPCDPIKRANIPSYCKVFIELSRCANILIILSPNNLSTS